MNEQATLQTIAWLMERVAAEADGLKAQMATLKAGLTRIEARVHDVEAGVDWRGARIDNLEGRVDRLEARVDRRGGVKMRKPLVFQIHDILDEPAQKAWRKLATTSLGYELR
jgi:hypothetical protein